MADDAFLHKAIKTLNKYNRQKHISFDDAIELLIENIPEYEDLSVEEQNRIVKEALKQHLETAASSPRPNASGGRGAHPAPSRSCTTRDPPPQDMLTAPYRFVVLEDRVVLAPKASQQAQYGFPIAGGFSGTLDVDWAFETPMLIGVDKDGVDGPMQIDADYVIPGATLRGMLRAAMGIVCRARLTQVNANHRYGVRDFTHPLFKEGQGAGAARLAWERLGAGWLRKAPASQAEKDQGLSDYVLTPCDKKIVRIRALPKSFNSERPTDNGQWHVEWLRTILGERYGKARYVKEKLGVKKWVFDFENSAQTFFAPDPTVNPKDAAAKDYVIPGGAGGRKGWFVFSSSSPSLKNIDPATLDAQQSAPKQGDQKKREYVFFDRPQARTVRLRQDVWECFERINCKPGKTKPKPDGSYAVMEPTLSAGRRIPVFYAGDPDDQELGFDMGLTRLFKLPHANSVGDVLRRQGAHKIDLGQPDMVEALFGHVYDRADLDRSDEPPPEAARKGRVAFGFAKLLDQETPASTTNVITTVALAPRASYAPYYLRGPIKDWTDEATNGRAGDARLAGRKRYFARFPAADLTQAGSVIEKTLSARKGETGADTQTRLRLLKAQQPGGELRFSGAIRLHNVAAEEVGALLWTLTHGGDPDKHYRHMIGRAKNAGAGQARVRRLRLKLTAHPGRGARADLLKAPEDWETQGADGGWIAEGGQSLGPFLREFEAYMRAEADRNWPRTDDIREFLGACDPVAGAKLQAAFLPTPNDFGDLRKLVKADTRNDPKKADDRLLPAPQRCPWRGLT